VSVLKEGDLHHLPDGRLHSEGFRSYLAVPLASGGDVLGVLEFFSRGPILSDSTQLRMLDALAGQAAITLEMARLKGSGSARD
jgi:GAF domain-containing protein